MKKIIVLILLSISFFTVNLQVSYAEDAVENCKFDGSTTNPIAGIVDGCFEDTLVKETQGLNFQSGDGTNAIINKIIGILGTFLSIGAVAMIVYSGFLMTLSGGEDEKIKKGKDLLKWTLIGYIALLTAGGIVSLVISTIYDFSA